MKITFKPIISWLKTHRLRLKKPHISDETKQEIGLIIFFCMIFVGICGFDWRIACIICGLMGTWYFFPRE